MNRVPDRKRLRRQFLEQQAILHAGWFAGFLSYILVYIIAVCFGLLAICCFMIAIFYTAGIGTPWKILEWFLLCAACVALSALFCFIALKCLHAGEEAEKRRETMPFVPPVSKAVALPADEILVRGSEEPSFDQRDVLLRAAKEVETPNEELLRVPEE